MFLLKFSKSTAMKRKIELPQTENDGRFAISMVVSSSLNYF